MDFEVEATPIADDRAMLVSVYGELDLATCGQLASITDDTSAEDRAIILDLTECSFIDSMGLSQVLRITGEFNGARPQAPVAIVSPHGSATSRLMELTGVDERLRLFGTVEDAVAWLEAESWQNGRFKGTDGTHS